MGYGLMPPSERTGCIYCRESGFYPSDMDLCDVYCPCPAGERLKIEDEVKEVARRMATPEARERRKEAAKRSRERAAEIVKSGEIDEAFLRRRVTFDMSNHAYVSPRGTTTPIKVNALLKKIVAEDLRGLFELRRDSDVHWTVDVLDDIGFGATVLLRSKRSIDINPGHRGGIAGYVMHVLQTRLAMELNGRCSDDATRQVTDPEPLLPTFHFYIAHIYDSYPEEERDEYLAVLARQREVWKKALPERLQPVLDGVAGMKKVVKVNVDVLERTEEEGWSLDKYEVTSDYPNVAAKGQDLKALLNHVKGSCICALGELIKEVPDNVEIEFVVTRRDQLTVT